MRTDKLQPVIGAALLVAELTADPDERRAQEPHSFQAAQTTNLGATGVTRMDPAIAGLIGAAIGGGLTLLKSLVDARSQRQLERAKAEWMRENAVATELRSHISTVGKELVSIQHSMEWMCSATDGGGELTLAVMENYHAEIHATIPRLLGALAAVASIDEAAYVQCSVMADEVFELDSRIADVLRGYTSSPSSVSRSIADLREPVTLLYKQLPRRIAQVLRRHSGSSGSTPQVVTGAA